MDDSIYGCDNYIAFDSFLTDRQITRILLVSGGRIKLPHILDELIKSKRNIYPFSGYSPNPSFDSVINGVEAFKKNRCDAVMAIGGGSSIDVAKCIKLYATAPSEIDIVSWIPETNDIPLICIPTTAGSGSEATSFAVIYKDGGKISIEHNSLIPGFVLDIPELLFTLPVYQKKVTMLDALSHAVESFWSVNSTEESKKYSKNAIELILDNYIGFLQNDYNSCVNMLKAANIAGKAINISKTTAGHALSYKLITEFGLPHGHAVALCLNGVWKYMLNHIECCVDPRGEKYIRSIFQELNDLFCYPYRSNYVERSDNDALILYNGIIEQLDIVSPKIQNVKDIDLLVKSVNKDRLNNNPIKLSEDAIREIYYDIFKWDVD